MRGAAIVSIGGITIDVILRLPELPSPGRCIAATAVYQGVGGKAANQAVAAARLDGAVSLVGAVGDDAAGDLALRQLAHEGVRVEWIRRAAGTATGTVVLQRDDAGRKQVAVFSGANALLTTADVDAARRAIEAARVVMVQMEIPLDAAVRAIDLARAAGTSIIFDASPVRTLPAELLRGIQVLKANAAEARALTGIDVRDPASARAAAERLVAMGPQLVALEAGTAGNLFYSEREEVFLPLLDVPSVDPTGAGDAVVGAFAVAMTESRSLRAAAELATTAAALTTRAFGAQTAMPRREEVEALR